MFVVVGTSGTEHLGSLLGQRPANGWSSHSVSERQHANALERTFCTPIVEYRSVADAPQSDHGLTRQQSTLFMRSPLGLVADHTDRQPLQGRRLLQLEGVPRTDRL